MGFMSIFTNIILFTFASDQIDFLIPALSKYKSDSMQSLLTVFGIEHVLILFVVFLRSIFDRDPKWV